MTSSRYAMRKKFTFAIREVFRGFPACFVHRDTRCYFELVSAPFQGSFSTIFEAGELSRSLRRHLGSIRGLEDLVYM
ncbi:hypothetical protein E3N88_19539 [Mikania micrantha]|uniref:Uncharacterized protein n=1 Tax=Mikania micrantha TaxID=192012 RepID=A0A5N6NQG0_9ASTR|nr:hypothetical protein E3N88_31804 [Mikania micrantha]KAD4982867.1 hypothetical protein E3N88_19538 [Mikania micrantha]KAD4982868.1 hypothetical protein E3N88_19539 [Mikania micrantha]